MVYRGRVQNGVVVLDDGVVLAEGTRVIVTVVPTETPEDEADVPTLHEQLEPLVGSVDGLPPDMAANHDHYLHGQPKRQSTSTQHQSTHRTLTIEYGDDLLAGLGLSPDEFVHEARFLLAAKLYELGRVTAGQAAALCGKPRIDFLLTLPRAGVPVSNLRPEDADAEAAFARVRRRELTDRDQQALLDLLAHPDGPNAALLHAARRYCERYGG